jgi:hypothetical protein
VTAAQRQFAAEHAEYIRRIVAEMPPLSDREKERLAVLLRLGVLAYWRRRKEEEAHGRQAGPRGSPDLAAAGPLNSAKKPAARPAKSQPR